MCMSLFRYQDKGHLLLYVAEEARNHGAAPFESLSVLSRLLNMLRGILWNPFDLFHFPYLLSIFQNSIFSMLFNDILCSLLLFHVFTLF